MSQRSLSLSAEQFSKRRYSLSWSAQLLLKKPRLYLMCAALLSPMLVMPNAQAASCKIPKSYYKNVACTSARGYFLATKDFGDAPVALIDSKGKRVIDLSRYQKVDANKMSEGLLPVLRNGRVGYVNMEGREVVPAIYGMLKGNQGWARPASEGRIIVQMNGDYGVITTSNQTIVPFSSVIKDIDDYRGGVARVSRNQSIGWLDRDGKTARDPNDNSDNDTLSAANNTSANTAKPANLPAKMPFTTLQPDQQDGRWGFVDDNNVTMITYSFDEVKPFSEGLAAVRIEDKWGFVNLGGELTIPFRFDDNGLSKDNSDNNATAFVFKEGKAWVGSLQDGSKLCIDKEGTNVSCD